MNQRTRTHLELNHWHKRILKSSEKTINRFISFSSLHPDLRGLLIYIFWMSLDIPKIIKSINSKEADHKFITDMVYFGFGRQLSRDKEANEAMLNATRNLNSEKSKQILMESPVIEYDTRLALALVSNLNCQDFSSFTAEKKNMDFLKNIFENLEEEEIKILFQNNIQFYYNFTTLLKTEQSFRSMQNRYQSDLEAFGQITELIEKIRESLQPLAENPAGWKKRKIGIVWECIKKAPNRRLLLQMLSKQGIVEEDTELKILEYFSDNSQYLESASERH